MLHGDSICPGEMVDMYDLYEEEDLEEENYFVDIIDPVDPYPFDLRWLETWAGTTWERALDIYDEYVARGFPVRLCMWPDRIVLSHS